MTSSARGLLDTSVFIASESGRAVRTDRLPAESYVSVITIAELHAGVLAAQDTQTRSRRLATLDGISAMQPLPVDAEAARHWASLRVRLAEAGRRININDLWIASIAAANDLVIVTQDADYETLEAVGGPPVIHV